MFIQMKRTLATPGQAYHFRHVYDVEEPLAAEFIRRGHAEVTTTPPPHIQQLLDRLEDGAGKPCLFLPFLGEFGHEIMSHIRLVHFHQASEKVVCCRPGCEVLYPSADRFITDWHDPIPDAERVGTWRGQSVEWPDIERQFPDHHPVAAGNLTPAQELFCIRPDEPIKFYPEQRGLTADVVLGVRRRDYCPERNWPHWQTVADAVTAAGFTFAVIGDKATSLNLKGQVCHSGDYDTDAAVELLQNCRLYIGTDTGSSHLAAAVGCPMLVFREVAGGSRDLTGRMIEANPGQVETIAAWGNPELLITRMRNILKGKVTIQDTTGSSDDPGATCRQMERDGYRQVAKLGDNPILRSVDVPHQIDRLGKEAMAELEQVNTPAALEQYRIRYLGTNGRVKNLLMQFCQSPEVKPKAIQQANELRQRIIEAFEAAQGAIGEGIGGRS